MYTFKILVSNSRLKLYFTELNMVDLRLSAHMQKNLKHLLKAEKSLKKSKEKFHLEIKEKIALSNITNHFISGRI